MRSYRRLRRGSPTSVSRLTRSLARSLKRYKRASTKVGPPVGSSVCAVAGSLTRSPALAQLSPRGWPVPNPQRGAAILRCGDPGAADGGLVGLELSLGMSRIGRVANGSDKLWTCASGEQVRGVYVCYCTFDPSVDGEGDVRARVSLRSGESGGCALSLYTVPSSLTVFLGMFLLGKPISRLS